VWSIYLSMAEKRKLGEMLLEAGLINELQLRGALNDQRQWGRPLGVTLISMGFVSEAELMRVLSDQLCYPFADLDAKIVAPEVIELVPYEIAAKHHCLPLTVQRKGSVRELYLAMFDPTDLAVIDDIEDPGAAKRRVRPATTEPEPVTGPTLELESESSVSQPLVPVDEPELVLTEKMSAPTEAFFTSSPESQRYVLQALVQLLISEDLIDPDRLFKTIKSIAGERD
jgi:hypothetical protein